MWAIEVITILATLLLLPFAMLTVIWLERQGWII